MEEMVFPKATHRVRTRQQSQLTPEQVDQILSIRAEAVGFTTKSAFLTEEGYLWKNILFILSGERLGTWWWFADAEKRSSAGLDGSKALVARFLPPWVREGERRGLGRREDGPWGCLVWVGRTRKNEKNIIGGYLGKRVILRW